MAWFKIDDKLHDHPKIRKLRDHKLEALGLWTACGSWSADTLSDGFVPREIVHRFDPDEVIAKRLVSVGLWIPCELDGEDGYAFHQWTEHQPTRAEVERRRGEARDRMRRNRARSQDVRANSARSSTNTFERTETNVSDDPTDDPARSDFYVASSASPQAQDSVRTNNERTSREVRDPVPSRPSLSTLATADAAAKFDEWWALYPLKVKKLEARKAWSTVLKRKVQPDHIIAGLRRQLDAWRAENKDPKYIPHPPSWLRAGSYDDEFEQQTLSLVPNPPAFDSFEAIHSNAAASDAARLLGIACILREQPPSDGTPRTEWLRQARIEWIAAHEQELRAALNERKTG
jgi:hypothetical protein